PLFHQYDAFEDTPWFIFYRELLKAFPRGRFILTVRDSEKWYKSMTKHFGGYDRESFRWIYEGYGDPLDNKKLYISKYRQHNRDVQNYFREKDKDLLVMSMPQDFNWEILCGYLECSPPFGSFPHANTASSRDSVKRKMIDLMKHKYYRYNS
ncbi:MAG: sulfotransferase, partial [Balneolaceae bacterium]